jgi:predicted dehydrogenase
MGECNVRTYRIGLIGAGARGETFARQLSQGTERAELFGVCDIDEDRLNKFCDYCGLGDAKRCTDTLAFVNEPGLDAVIITVPEFAHKDVAVAAMKAGKHVYIEKPLAHTLEDCREIIRANRQTRTVAYVGFNRRADAACQELKSLIAGGAVGQVIHISGLDQLKREHGASFMRRFHRKSKNTGGMMNHKCSHDLDIMLWVIGHEHKARKIASFGGTNIFTPDKQPAKCCRECPPQIAEACPYKFQPGYVFPITSKDPLCHRDSETYGGDLCVYNPDKDIVDNQAVIIEFDNGVRADFRLEMFQAEGRCQIIVWGEKGMVEMSSHPEQSVRVISSVGHTTCYDFPKNVGLHGGTDAMMIARFVEAMDKGAAHESGLADGLAAAIVGLKADESRLTGRVIEISPEEYIV